MDKRKFEELIDGIDDEFLVESEEKETLTNDKRHNFRAFLNIGIVAACIAVLFIAVYVNMKPKKETDSEVGTSESLREIESTENSETTETTETTETIETTETTETNTSLQPEEPLTERDHLMGLLDETADEVLYQRVQIENGNFVDLAMNILEEKESHIIKINGETMIVEVYEFKEECSHAEGYDRNIVAFYNKNGEIVDQITITGDKNSYRICDGADGDDCILVFTERQDMMNCISQEQFYLTLENGKIVKKEATFNLGFEIFDVMDDYNNYTKVYCKMQDEGGISVYCQKGELNEESIYVNKFELAAYYVWNPEKKEFERQ